MRSILTLTLLATSLTLIGCQKKSDVAPVVAPTANPMEEMRTMGSHDPQGCPALDGIYVPVNGTGSLFLFEKIDGSLVMKSRRPEGGEFQGGVPINGKTFYNGGESATARCYGGKIVVDVSHPSKPKKTALLKGGPQGMTRVIFQDGKELQTNEYTRMIQ